MSAYQEFPVILTDGTQATVLAKSRFLDTSESRLIRLPDGREVHVPRTLLHLEDDGSYRMTAPLFDEPAPAHISEQNNAVREVESAAIPVIEEDLRVTREPVETGRVLIHKKVETTDSIVDEPLLQESYDVERVPMNRVLTEAPAPRREGETWILPVLEEVLVVEKRLVLREEVRITRVQREVHHPQKHSVRREHIEVERK